MGPVVVVVVPLAREHLAGVSKAVEHLFVEALVTELAVDPKGGEANLSTKPFCWGLPGVT